MAELTYPILTQGAAIVAGKTIFTPSTNHHAVIQNIRINNTVAAGYTITLYRANENGTKTIMYSFTLSSGDVLNDDTTYEMKYGSSLFLTASSTTVEYCISGKYYPII